MRKKYNTILRMAILIFVIVLFMGCIRSRVVITTDPPGADITCNNEYRGASPMTIPIIWYWFYDFEIEKEGYERIFTRERFHAPVWTYMPLDLIVEALPFPLYDTKNRHYILIAEEEL